ncbi:sensor histidine kinase [Celeribacter arenosi]|uniref:histidine kinase n=1 Tax=Celeribacter arenosi TaxID=792649 RepID=A0ABP7KBW1_9RHOB
MENTAPETQAISKPHTSARRRLIGAVLFVLCTAGFGLGVYAVAFRAELDQASERGHADLTLAADRLTTDLQRHRDLGVFLADHPTVLSLVLERGQTRDTVEATHALLQAMVDKTGAAGIFVVGEDGRNLASAANSVGSYGVGRALERAGDGALGIERIIDPSGARTYVFAAPVFSPGGPSVGAVVVTVDVADVEWSWPTETATVYFTDESGLVFVTNRTELILTGRDGAGFPLVAKRTVGGHELYTLDAGPYIPARALHLTQPRPVIGLTAELLLDLAPVRSLAALQAGLTAAICLAFGALLFLATERRRTLAEANARLEARVAKRTQALEIANRDLKRAQADLVRAGKLTALGQMSAGISHELNQPLMAIRSFAENAQAFLERDRPEKAAENLGRISDLARRMGRIIKNLRAFARQETDTLADVDLTGVVDAALEVTDGKLALANVSVDWTAGAPVWVRGGEVRLQQVVVNLLSNAADAMRDSPQKRIEIDITGSDPVRLSVRDTGPGISEPDKIFDPFYTTKEVGASEGMGLGLSISYGLVQSFGGEIRGSNRPTGGAEFTIDLTAAKMREAAE